MLASHRSRKINPMDLLGEVICVVSRFIVSWLSEHRLGSRNGSAASIDRSKELWRSAVSPGDIPYMRPAAPAHSIGCRHH